MKYLSNNIDNIMTILSGFVASLTVITLLDILGYIWNLPNLIEWAWLFILIACFSASIGAFYLFQLKSLRFKLTIFGGLILSLVISILIHHQIIQ